MFRPCRSIHYRTLPRRARSTFAVTVFSDSRADPLVAASVIPVNL
ncbi:protein of unassigned function [Methylobacterium oryzae CBMB20]|uniref:Protein of unassigned function n=1 Tax=Methylobacterium oryzae CBMB20 TaxID=693986 RepID=A0A089QEP8_9HYPH|nr:protein of unassigned function [Methylobacterium oryzae CBMB20]